LRRQNHAPTVRKKAFKKLRKKHCFKTPQYQSKSLSPATCEQTSTRNSIMQSLKVQFTKNRSQQTLTAAGFQDGG
jgi:hypothetical protein